MLKRRRLLSSVGLGVALAPFVVAFGFGLKARADWGPGYDPKLLEQATLWPMTYETAETGKPVDWCVDHVGHDAAYLAGRPSQPLELVNDGQAPLNSPTSGGRCTRMLAVVEGRNTRGWPKLRFVAALR